MGFSVIMPIHNEERALQYSLPSIFSISPREVILLFDRCSDRSEAVSHTISSRYPTVSARFLQVTQEVTRGWSSRTGSIRRHAFAEANEDFILNTDADIVLDPIVSQHIMLLRGDTRLVKFGFLDYPYNIQTLSKRVVSGVTGPYDVLKGYAGLYAFQKRAWQECEDPNLAMKAEAEDSFLQLSISKRYRTTFRNTRSLHLRPAEGESKNFWRGMEYYNTVKASVPTALLHSFAMFRPHMLAGYLYARRKALATQRAESVHL